MRKAVTSSGRRVSSVLAAKFDLWLVLSVAVAVSFSCRLARSLRSLIVDPSLCGRFSFRKSRPLIARLFNDSTRKLTAVGKFFDFFRCVAGFFRRWSRVEQTNVVQCGGFFLRVCVTRPRPVCARLFG